MGNDAYIFCKTCRMRACIGRAYNYKKQYINAKFPQEIIDKLIILTEKINAVIEEGIIEDSSVYGFSMFEEIIEFSKLHEGHELWIIDDFSSFKWSDDVDAEK